ncbi:hypothetical protein M3J09_001182 [Ascochyta lentis]
MKVRSPALRLKVESLNSSYSRLAENNPSPNVPCKKRNLNIHFRNPTSMSRALKSSLQSLKNWVLQSSSRVQKIASGQGTARTRVAPAQSSNNNQTISSRLDDGEIFKRDSNNTSDISLR